MGNYTKTIKYETDFDGDHIKVEMKRLKRPDAVQIIPLVGEPDKDGSYKIENLVDQIELMNSMSDLLTDPGKKYIINFSGLKIEDKELIMQDGNIPEEDIELFNEVFTGAYFMPLLAEFTAELMDKSFLKEEDKKKLESQQGDISEDSEKLIA